MAVSLPFYTKTSTTPIVKELVHPVTRYLRGVLRFDGDRFTFTPYREPFRQLRRQSWDTERAFMDDYQKLVKAAGRDR